MISIGYLEVAIKAIPILIKLAEWLFRKTPKSGGLKKDWVVDKLKMLVDTVGGASTGGQKDTWSVIGDPVKELIDVVAGALFPNTPPDVTPEPPKPEA